MVLYNYHLTSLPLLLFLLLVINNAAVAKPEEYKTYIIHMDYSHKPSAFLTGESWYRGILKGLSTEDDDKEMFIYSYNHVLHGFSARLTPSQASEIKKSAAHIFSHEEVSGKLFTTHSPEFMGLSYSSGLWNASSFGEGVIVAIIDSGVWPESESFYDNDMPPIPTRWKGKCQNDTGDPFPCNRKLIGAQTFIKGSQAAGNAKASDDTPRDSLGHGTHTSSTAVGNHVAGASLYGYAKGTARGIAPQAHLAMYKVSPGDAIAESDVLAAMDQAIADGVDIMSLSLGFGQRPYFQNMIAIASLSAIKKGIAVVCAAGNAGKPNTTDNAIPWVTTVGAGTLDRSFIATITLGNGQTFEGKSEFPQRVLVLDTPLYYGKDDFNKKICNALAYNKSEVEGKVVICDNSDSISITDQAIELENAGALAGILMADSTPAGFDQILNVACIVTSTSSGALIRKYAIEAAAEAKVKIMRFVLTSFGAKPAPQVADFSSRGPDPINPNILKPDIIAPGDIILAAFPSVIPAGKIGDYTVASDYVFFSGTSMSAPHVAGVTALLKAVHPEWSPAAIRSALMTTANTIDNNGATITDKLTNLPGTPLDYGAGHINPNKAMNPGLVYDIDWQGYVDFLCGLGYNDTEMKATLRQSQWNCSQEGTDLNYPSFVAIFSQQNSPANVKSFTRVVTNVGDEQSVYKAVVETPDEMSVRVDPNTLTFTSKNQKQSYVVSVETRGQASPVTYGYLKWIDQNSHVVASPVVVLNL